MAELRVYLTLIGQLKSNLNSLESALDFDLQLVKRKHRIARRQRKNYAQTA
jgi:hypothetical protein